MLLNLPVVLRGNESVTYIIAFMIYLHGMPALTLGRGVRSNFGLVRQKIWGLPVSGLGNVYIGSLHTYTRGSRACPPQKILKIAPSEIESENISNDL